MIDAGSEPTGTGDVLDLSQAQVTRPVIHAISDGATVTTLGVDFESGLIAGLDNLTFKNFDILTGTSLGDYIVNDTGFKQINLGNGNNVVGDLTGSVLPGDETKADNKWVVVNLGTGADTITGGLARGSEVNLGLGDGAVDKVLNVMDDVRINQAGTEDKFYIFGGTVQLHGGDRNTSSESAWSYGPNGVRYGVDSAGELEINFAGSTMYVSNYQNSLTQSQATGGVLLFQYSIAATTLLNPNRPAGSQLNTFELAYGYMWKIAYGYSEWHGVDPLVLDLGGQGIVTTATPNVGSDGTGYGIRFDMKGDGFAVPTGWISENDAFVVRDLNGNGKIDSVNEIVGQGMSSGFMSLATYDYNGDGKVDAADWIDLNGNGVRDAGEGALDVLRIWRDANGNGITDPGELMTFAQAGITSIALTSSKLTGDFDNGNQILDTGSFTRIDGTLGAASDVTFSIDSYDAQWNPAAPPVITPVIAALAQIKGHGSVMDLQDAMALDEQAADETQAALEQKTGAVVARRETLADIVTRLGPTLDQPELAALRTAAAPILQAWARTAALVQPAAPSPAAANGGRSVLDFVVHHAGGPDQQIDYAYQVTETVTDQSGAATAVTCWTLGSGAAVTDASGAIIAHPTSQDILAYAPVTGGVWQIDDGQARDLAPVSPHDSVKVFVVMDGGRQRIADYAYLDPAGAGSWKLASGAAITDASGAAIANPTYADVLASKPVAGGTWESFDGADPAFQPGTAGQGLTLLVSRDAAGDETVVDYAYSVSETDVVNGQAQTIVLWKLGSGSPVVDGSGSVIARPTLAQVEAAPAANESWEHFTGATVETSASLPDQGLTIFVGTGAGGTEQVLDTAYAVTETVSDPGSALGFQQVTSWRLGSMAPVLDAAGQAIARPTYDQILASVPQAGGAWQHFDGATADVTASNANGQILILSRANLDGTSQIVDFATLTTETVMAAGSTGFAPQVQSVWTLGSGNLVQDASGTLIAAPTLAQVEAYASAQGATAQLYSGASFGLATQAKHQGMTVFIQHVDGQPDHVADFAYEVTAPLVVTDGTGAHVADVSYWKLGSGTAVTDAQGNVIPYATLDQVLATAPAAGGAWQHFDGATIDFLEAYMGDKIAVDLPGVSTTESFADFTAAFDILLGRVDDVAVRLAVQTGLKPFFEDVAYDAGTDTFSPTTDRQLTPTYQAILTATEGMDGAQEASYLGRWKAVLDVVIADYSRGTGAGNNYGFIFTDIAAAFEAVGPQTALGITATAEALGIPQGLVIARPGDIDGTDDPDIIYLNYGDQTARGGGGLDNYVMGANFGHDVVDDIEVFGHQTAYDDNLRFTQYSLPDLTFARDGEDLLIGVVGRTDQTIRVVDEFHGITPTFFGGNVADDTGVGEIVFADGTVWDKIDLARAVRHVTPVDGVVNGTNDDDVLDGGPGADYVMRGGNGSDDYIWGSGYGNDTIDDSPDNAFDLGINTVEFTADVAESDISFSRKEGTDDLTIHVAGQDQVLTIRGEFAITETGVLGSYAFNQIQDLTFDAPQSSPISVAQIQSTLIAQSETAGNDRIFGFHGDDRLDGKGGNDFLSGGDGNDTYVYDIGYGHDTIDTNIDNFLADHTDTVQFGAGITLANTTFSRPAGTNDLLITPPGSGGLLISGQFSYVDTIFGVLRYHSVSNFTFSDGTTLSFGEIALRILQQQETQSGVTIVGLPSPTTFDDSHGDVTLEGDDFGNTYNFGRGYGHDTILQNPDENNGEGGTNTVAFGAGIGPSDLQLSVGKSPGDLVIRLAGTEDELTIINTMPDYFSVHQVQQFSFADGTVWSLSDMEQHLLAQESASSDPVIFGFVGNDTIDAGTGGTRFLVAGTGDDTYRYSMASGNDTIDESSDPMFGRGSNDDTLVFTDIAPDQVAFSRRGDDLLVKILPTGTTLTVTLQFENAGRIEHFQFADGTALGSLDIERLVLAGESASSDERISGFSDGSTVAAGTANRSLTSGGGTTTYLYTAAGGNDTIDNQGAPNGALVLSDLNASDVRVEQSTASGDVILSLSTGRTISLLDQSGGGGIQTITFADGSTWSASDIVARTDTSLVDTILGTRDDDVLDAGTGDAYLSGGGGSDRYIYSSLGGNDTIFAASSEHFSGDLRALTLTDLTAADVVFRSDLNDLFIDVKATGRTLTILAYFGYLNENTIGTIHFSDGTVWTETDVSAAVAAHETAAGEVQVLGSETNDTLVAGTGDRYLSGGTGDDVYVYSSAGGNDTIEALGNRYDTQNRTLVFSDIAASDVTFTRLPGHLDLIVTVLSTGRTVFVKSQFSDASDDRISSFQFADGTTLSDADVEANILQQQSAPGSTLIQGDYHDDTIVAGTGDQVLSGGGGNDLYEYAAADGNDTIDDEGGPSQLFFTDLESTQVRLQRADGSADLQAAIGSTGKIVTIPSFFLNRSGLTSIRFSDGVVIGVGQIQAATASSLLGTLGNDTLTATAADTVMKGGGGSDTYVYGSADGNLTIDNTPSSGAGTLVLTDLNAADLLFQRQGSTNDLDIRVRSTGRDIIVKSAFDAWGYGSLQSVTFADGTMWTGSTLAAAADQVLQAPAAGGSSTAGSGSDTLSGGAGNDVLTGGSGRDTIFGGAGNNLLTAGAGADLFVVAAQAGQNEIAGFRSGVDRIKIDPGVFATYADLVANASDLTGSIVATGHDGSTLTIDGVSLSQLQPTDLVFASVVQTDGMVNLADGPGPGVDASGTYHYDTSAAASALVLGPSDGVSRLAFDDVVSANVNISRDGMSGDLLIAIPLLGKTVTLRSEFGASLPAAATINFADGVTWTVADLQSRLVQAENGTAFGNVYGFAGDDTLILSTSGHTYVGGDGSDTYLYSSAEGNDTIDDRGTVGANTLKLTDLAADQIAISHSADGTDALIGYGAAGQVLTLEGALTGSASATIGMIAFADGSATALMPGLRGVIASHTLTYVAGAGDDTLQGASFAKYETNDAFVYQSSNANVLVEAHVGGADSFFDTLFLSDLNQADVTISRVAGDLSVAVNGTGKAVTVGGEFNSTYHDGVQQIVFADGSTLSRDQIQAMAWYRAGAGDAIVTAQDGNATLEAGPGNDTLVGGDASNDGASDTFVYASADGNLDLRAHLVGANNFDNTLVLTDLNAADVSFSRVESDLFVTVKATGRVISIAGEFNSTTRDGIQHVQFADGSLLSRAQIEAQTWFHGTPGSADDAYDTANRSGFTYDLGAGDHGVTNAYHDDSLAVVWDRNDGNERFVINGGDTVSATLDITGLSLSELAFSRAGNDLVILNVATQTSMTLTNQFYRGYAFGVATIAFDDGTSLDQTQIAQAAFIRGAPGSGADAYDTDHQDSVTYDLGAGSHGVVAAYHDPGLTIIWGASDGDETFAINDDNLDASDSTLKITALTPSGVQLARVGNDLQVLNVSAGTTMTIQGQFAQANLGVGSIAFDDGTTLDRSQIAVLTVTGGASPSGVQFSASSTTKNIGNNANEIIDVVFDGNNDTIYSSGPVARYHYASGDGYAAIFDTGSKISTLLLSDLNPSNVTFSQAASPYGNGVEDLQIEVAATGKTIVVNGQLSSGQDGIGSIVFANGTRWNATQIQAAATSTAGPLAIEQSGTDPNNSTITGANVDVVSTAGADEGHGLSNTTKLIWNVYAGVGQGDPNLYPYGTRDLEGGTVDLHGLNPGDVAISINPYATQDLILTDVKTGDTVNLGHEDNTDFSAFDTVNFDDGTSWSRAFLLDHVTEVVGEGLTVNASPGSTGATIYTAIGGGTLNLHGAGGATIAYSTDTGAAGANSGNGDVFINDNSAGSDTLLLRDLDSSDVTLAQQGRALVVTVSSSGATIALENEFANGEPAVSTIAFADGTSVAASTLGVIGDLTTGTPGSASDVYDTSGRANEIYDLGPGDHGLVSAYHDDPLTVVWGASDGNEDFVIESNNYTNDATLRLTGLTLADVSFSRLANGTLQVVNLATQKAISIERQFNLPWQGVFQVVFDDGTILTQDQIANLAYIRGTPGSGDDAYDTDGQTNVVYDLGVGDHGIAYTTNNDATRFIWDGGDGNEHFYTYRRNGAGSANAVLTIDDLLSTGVQYSRSGDDLIVTDTATQKSVHFDYQFRYANEGLGTIDFTADGVSVGNSQIAALAYVRDGEELDGRSNVTYDLGLGDHALVYTQNNDATRFVWDGADGNEEFYTFRRNGAGSANAVLAINDLASTDVELSRSGSNLIVTNTLSGKSVQFDYQFRYANEGLGTINFTADGVTMNNNQIVASAYVRDVEELDEQSAVSYDLGAGDHAIVYTQNNDATRFVWNGADGNEEFYTYRRNGAGSANAVLTIDDLASTDVQLSRSGSDLVVTNTLTQKSVQIDYQFRYANEGLGTIDFTADGVTLDNDQIAAAAWYRAGNNGDVTVTAAADNATMQAGSGSDTLVDSHDQGTFVYSSANGNLSLQAHTNASHFDTLNLADLNASDVSFSRNGSDLLIGVNATSHAITVAGEFNTPDQDGIQKIAFANGTALNHDQIVAATNPPA